MREVSLGILVLAIGCPVLYGLPNMQPKGSGLSRLHLLHQGIRTGRLTCAVGRAWPQSSFLHGWAFLRCRSRLSMLERKDCFPGCPSTLHRRLQMSCQRVTDAALCGQQQGSWRSLCSRGGGDWCVSSQPSAADLEPRCSSFRSSSWFYIALYSWVLSDWTVCF